MSRLMDKLFRRELDMDLVREARKLGVPLGDILLIADYYGPGEANARLRGTIETMRSLPPMERIDLKTWSPS